MAQLNWPGRETSSRLPPFQQRRKKRKRELGHLAWCLIICVPTCTTVCLVVDRLFGG